MPGLSFELSETGVGKVVCFNSRRYGTQGESASYFFLDFVILFFPICSNNACQIYRHADLARRLEDFMACLIQITHY